MQVRHEHNGLVWVDIESPTRDEIRSIMLEFGLKPLIAEELLLPSVKPRAEFSDDHAFFVLHFPTPHHGIKHREQEVDFVVGRHFIITTRYDAVVPLSQFSKIFQANSILEESNVGDHAGFLLFYMLKRLYKAVEHEVDHIRDNLAHIEERVFAGNEVEMVFEISQAARDLLNVRQSIEPHRDALHTLETEGVRFFGQEFASYLRGLSNEYYRVHNHVMRETESLHELRATNNSLLSTKQNETMKVFTIMAFITFPLTLITTIFSTDAKHTPFIGNAYDFWIILSILAVAALSMLAYFKHKKWI